MPMKKLLWGALEEESSEGEGYLEQPSPLHKALLLLKMMLLKLVLHWKLLQELPTRTSSLHLLLFVTESCWTKLCQSRLGLGCSKLFVALSSLEVVS